MIQARCATRKAVRGVRWRNITDVHSSTTQTRLMGLEYIYAYIDPQTTTPTDRHDMAIPWSVWSQGIHFYTCRTLSWFAKAVSRYHPRFVAKHDMIQREREGRPPMLFTFISSGLTCQSTCLSMGHRTSSNYSLGICLFKEPSISCSHEFAWSWVL